MQNKNVYGEEARLEHELAKAQDAAEPWSQETIEVYRAKLAAINSQAAELDMDALHLEAFLEREVEDSYRV